MVVLLIVRAFLLVVVIKYVVVIIRQLYVIHGVSLINVHLYMDVAVI